MVKIKMNNGDTYIVEKTKEEIKKLNGFLDVKKDLESNEIVCIRIENILSIEDYIEPQFRATWFYPTK